MILKKINFNSLLVLGIIPLIFSCASRKDVVYFQDASAFETIVSDNTHTNKFKVDDVVNIHISTLDPQASVPFNLFKGSDESGVRPQQVDYIIDKNGEIDFPVIGKIRLVGLSPEETKILLTEKLKDYLKDPIINIRIQNFTVTVLGEVNRPGTYPVNGEQITILEAIGLANDLTIKGKRNNVMVIRDFNGTKVYTRLDLTKKEALSSPVFYLTQNDVVYVEPNNSAIKTSTLDNRASIYLSVFSLLVTSTILILRTN
ncbi:polysaccharide biosynthesis/export family protein [uncultured Maribacter sp.]|mgnify:FL=1|uniref:polysaccharide biosynthesis/export family protein n=1 Tax=uncultured Maribacter sp. TaxID=431308 RepID=UPI0030ECAA81|tara:strand:+ start:66009 stop:66782 length:774 start_codon:yes stop_codon:yes gene_type:complete